MSLYFHDMGKEYAFTFLVAENTDVLRGDMMCRTLQANLLSESHILFIFCTQIFRAALPKLETIKISIHLQENGQTNCGKSMQWCATLKQKGINYWINLKISTPSAKSQTKRSRRDRIPFIQNSWKCQLMCSDKSHIVAWGGNERQKLFGTNYSRLSHKRRAGRAHIGSLAEERPSVGKCAAWN